MQCLAFNCESAHRVPQITVHVAYIPLPYLAWCELTWSSWWLEWQHVRGVWCSNVRLPHVSSGVSVSGTLQHTGNTCTLLHCTLQIQMEKWTRSSTCKKTLFRKGEYICCSSRAPSYNYNLHYTFTFLVSIQWNLSTPEIVSFPDPSSEKKRVWWLLSKLLVVLSQQNVTSYATASNMHVWPVYSPIRLLLG